MRVLIAGVDGYLGWPLAQYLAANGHSVGGIDRFLRRSWVSEVGGISAIPIAEWSDRERAYLDRYGEPLEFFAGDMLDYSFLSAAIAAFRPDAVVHLAEMPSAPYSMIDQAHSIYTQQNNVIGSLNLLWALHSHAPDAHLVKLGTMGEYGTPNIDIPEGFFEVEYRGRRDRLPFPRQAGSFYHWSKVHDSNNTMFACKIWGLRATDVMQGVVYGTRTETMISGDTRYSTRLDFDACFGTLINRFVCQAVIGHPLTVYGNGTQNRGFLTLQDSITCLTLALQNPPSAGEYRVINQFEETYSVEHLAKIVQTQAELLGLKPVIKRYENPRVEQVEHYYHPDRKTLLELGYQPKGNISSVVGGMLADVMPYKERILPYVNFFLPEIRWDTAHRKSNQIESCSR